jgi:FKBP-type peptidyl-prolyl cis-trans isomerase
MAIAQTDAPPTDIQSYLTTQNITAVATDYGLHYQIEKEGKGAKPKVGDYVALRFKGKLLDGTVFEASEAGEDFIFQVGYRQVIRGWDLGLREFPVGSTGKLFIPPNLGYGTTGAGELVPPNTPLIFEIELLKILTEEEYNEYMAALEAKEQAAFEAQIETQFIQDKKLIQNYVLDKRLRTKRTRSGLSYAITKKGKGATAKKGDELSVSYKGYLLDGKPFDASKAKETYKVLLGLGKVIKGWDEGLTFFTEGSEGILLIPSKLAYGPRGIYEKNVAIPPNSVLVFDIKVEKIKRKEVN